MNAKNVIIKEQFNKQAGNFNDWSITRNESILKSLCNFFSIEEDCRMLDFACGTGAFALYAGQRARAVQGVDISEGMINIAIEHAREQNLGNVSFLCCDVEKVPFESDGFERVVSKSAFHHMGNYGAVFKEMKRCCKKDGLIGIQDIVLYGDEETDDFFEKLECEIDISHRWSLSRQQFINLYKENNVEVVRIFESVSELNFNDYVGHAVQEEAAAQRIEELLNKSQNNKLLSEWFVTKQGQLFWKRKILTIMGRKAT